MASSPLYQRPDSSSMIWPPCLLDLVTLSLMLTLLQPPWPLHSSSCLARPHHSMWAHLSFLLLGELHTPCSFTSLSCPYSNVTFLDRPAPTTRLTPSSDTQFCFSAFIRPCISDHLAAQYIVYVLRGFVICINAMKKGNFVRFIHYLPLGPVLGM